MFDNTPLTLEERIDHCRALACAIIEVQDPAVKELLSFIQAEKLHNLYQSLDDVASENEHQR